MDPNWVIAAASFVLAIAAWVKWFSERGSISRYRGVLFLLGLCVGSLAVVEYFLLILFAHRIGGFGSDFGDFLGWARPGFFLSLLALILGFAGVGTSRFFVVALACGLLLVWVLLVNGM
jgi:hypothetical protein